ncbi:aspartyl protease family protein [Caulobacter sp. ErkDOM-YI]|uniref:aspartyl protease family protein n=1 Tax=unclassified Caulobacter TaxID=2648921 RepID=UPI003AF6E631
MVDSTISRRGMAGLAAALLAPPAFARDPDVSQVSSSEPLKYLDAARRLTVQVMLNGQGPFHMMVDTGANSSVISIETADKLGLARGAPVALHGIAGVQTVDTVVIDTLQMGHRMRRQMKVSIVAERHLGAAGLLGLDWLGANSLMLNYGKRRMAVGEPLPLPDERTVVVKTRTRSGLTLIDASIPSQKITAFIDSGSTTTVGNLALLRAAQARKAIIGAVFDIELRSATGQTLSGRLAVLNRLTLGKMTLMNVPVVVAPIHTFDYWGMSDEPAILIGSDILQKFETVALDFKRREVRFKIADRG